VHCGVCGVLRRIECFLVANCLCGGHVYQLDRQKQLRVRKCGVLRGVERRLVANCLCGGHVYQLDRQKQLRVRK